jgi:hypothetical protein
MKFGADYFDEKGPLINGLSLLDNVVTPFLWPERQLPFSPMDMHILPYASPILPTACLNTACARYIYEMRPLGHPDQWLASNPFQNISQQTLHAARQGRVLIIINDSLEGFPVVSTGIMSRLPRFIADCGLPPQNVWYLTSIQGDDAHEESTSFRIAVLDKFRYLMANNIKYQSEMFVEPEKARTAKRKTHYLCLNRQPRCHRISFVAELAARDLLQYGLVSFPDLKHWSGGLSYGTDDAKIEALRDMTPMYVDHTDFSVNFAFVVTTSHYLDTFFSVVTETIFQTISDSGLFRTEKIFKPICNLQPFLLVGQCGMLAALRELGFKTFAPFIDEAYDSESDDTKRLEMVLAETRRLCEMPHADLQAWYDTIFDDVLLFNRMHLAESHHGYDHILKTMNDFMKRNSNDNGSKSYSIQR